MIMGSKSRRDKKAIKIQRLKRAENRKRKQLLIESDVAVKPVKPKRSRVVKRKHLQNRDKVVNRATNDEGVVTKYLARNPKSFDVDNIVIDPLTSRIEKLFYVEESNKGKSNNQGKKGFRRKSIKPPENY